MPQSEVFLTDLRTRPRRNLLDKLDSLMEAAGAGEIEYEKKFVAVKMHFGEPGNLAYVRPNYAARVVELVKRHGGKPFLTDTNSLYTGRRGNAVDHLRAAAENGFSPLALGCDVIIADGLKGTDYREIPIGLKHVKLAKIGAVIADADVLLTISHFKGHELTGIGGAIKNLGMGCAARGGKLEMHSASKPRIREEKCKACLVCVKSCPQEAISIDQERGFAVIDYDACIGCGQCIAMCQYNAAQAVLNESASNASEKIAEYALAAVTGKPSFHVSLITDVSPLCDCWGQNDRAIVSDIGIAASNDPVALDRAAVDLVNEAALNAGGILDGKGLDPGDDKFGAIHPNTSWQLGLAYAESIGLGTQQYSVRTVD